MNLVEPNHKKTPENHSRLLLLSVLFSLVVHSVIFLLLPLLPQDDISQRQQPTIVQLVERPTPHPRKPRQKPAKFELDQPPAQHPAPTPVESHRKADQDQRVEREQAPKGDDVRDQKLRPALPEHQKQPPVAAPPRQKKIKETRPLKSRTKKVDKKSSIKKQITAEEVQPQQQRQQSPPDLFDLTQKTRERIDRGTLGSRNRTKERDDVPVGDTVWLNLQSNLLVSFFRRFHDQIEMVWNYPTQAAQAGIEGTLELQITVNRKGELLDVDLRHSSGSDLLDYEAIQAVYRAAPFGPLTKHYPHDKLKIRAHFSYQIAGRYIYGR